MKDIQTPIPGGLLRRDLPADLQVPADGADSTVWNQLEGLIQRFEHTWKHGRAPVIDEFLPGAGAERTLVLVELVHIDLEFRLKAGEPARVESYLEMYPELAGHSPTVLALIEAEYRLRCRQGTGVSPQEYVTRFPGHLPQLSAHLFGSRPGVTAPPEFVESGSVPSAGGYPAVAGYEILGELGRGGMGVVYKARHLKLKRLVALKVILAGEHAGPETLARFRTEAEAVARLQHPNLVQLHEVGEHEGRPYAALEFVDGPTLAQSLAGRPLPARPAAELANTLARAMHYAHERGIVHRDLKPANILLQIEGQNRGPGTTSSGQSAIPKITDFGLAKQLDVHVGQTRTGAVLGTPSYMAPEQARGRAGCVTPLADVYSLGAVLYEMLTGRPPFHGEAPLVTLLDVLAVEPVPPRRLQPRVPRDLELICLKCLEKEPRRRYPSAQALAEDLARFLAGTPVEARPTPAWERAWKWARREPKVAALAALSLLVTLVAFGLVTAQWLRALGLAEAEARAAEAAQHNEKEAAVQRDKARERLRLARMAVDKFYLQVSESPEMRAWGAEALRTRLLETAAEFYQQLTREEESNDPVLRAERGQALRRLGDLYRITGRNAEAEQMYRQALTIFQVLTAEQPGHEEYRAELASCHVALGTLFSTKERLQEAVECYREALAIEQKGTAKQRSSAESRRRLGALYVGLGSLYRSLGRRAEAEQAYGDALAAYQQLAAEQPQEPDRQASLAQSLHNLGLLYQDTDRATDAEQAYRQAAAIFRKLAADQPKVPKYQEGLAVAYLNLATLYSKAGRTQEAGEAWRQARDAEQPLATAHPGVLDYQEHLAICHHNLAQIHRTTGRRAEAELAERQALALYQALAANVPERPKYSLRLGTVQYQLGGLLAERDMPEKARAAYDQAIATLTPLLADGKWHNEVRQSLQLAHRAKATSLVKSGRNAEAVPERRRALELAPANDRLFLNFNLAYALIRAGDYRSAVAEAEKLEKDQPRSGNLLYNLAGVYSRALAAAAGDGTRPESERSRLAERYADRALELLRQGAAGGLLKNPSNLASLKKAAEFDPLRGREDFQRLLTDAERAANPTNP